MDKVIRTKYYSEKQGRLMAQNLNKKFGGTTSIDSNCWYMTHKLKPHTEYRLYIASKSMTFDFFSWEKLQNKYFELMED